MARIESTITVPNSIEDTFAFLNDAKSHARFIPNMGELTPTSDGLFGKVGATAHGVLSYFRLVKIPVEYEIIEHEPISKIAMKGLMGPVEFRDGYILHKQANGTEIKFWLDLNPTRWTKIFIPFAGIIGRIHAYETLRNIKREISKSTNGNRSI